METGSLIKDIIEVAVKSATKEAFIEATKESIRKTRALKKVLENRMANEKG